MKLDKITAVVPGNNGEILVGTSHGLLLYDGKMWLSYMDPEGYGEARVNTINIDKDQNVWIRTERGIFKMEKNRWKSYAMDD